MAGIKDRVAIIGMGCTKFGERWDASAADLMVEAAHEAFDDAGVEAKDIQAAWLGTVGSFRTGQPLADALKLDYIPISRLETPAPRPPTPSGMPATPWPPGSTTSCWRWAWRN